jgi:glycosidase
VYLSPIQEMSQVNGFTNPYRIKNYDRIDPEYGGEDDLRALVIEAHRLKLKVIMDIVYFHTAPDNVLITKHPEWYKHTPDGKIQLGPWRLPVLDWSKTDLREFAIANLVHWVRDTGIDGFRCDVAGSVPVDFWEQARQALDKVNPETIMLAESEKPEEQLSAFDISYSFQYQRMLERVFREGEPATMVRAQWEKTHAAFPRGARLLHLNDNHDLDRAAVVYGEKGNYAASVLNFTLDGVPFVYNGQEIGDTTATDHQSRMPIRWELDKVEGQRGSTLARPQKLKLAKFKRLFTLRRQQPALTAGDVVWVENSRPDSVVSFVRRTTGDEVLVLVNVTNRIVGGAVYLSPEKYATAAVLLPGERSSLVLEDKSLQFHLGAFDYLVVKAASGAPASNN